MVLREWPLGLSLQEVDLTYSAFWIQIYGLPLELMIETNVEKLGLVLDKLLEINQTSLPTTGPRQYLRPKVDINIDKPLFNGFSLPRINKVQQKLVSNMKGFQNFPMDVDV